MRRRAVLIIFPLVLFAGLFPQVGSTQLPTAGKLELVVQTGPSNSVTAVAVSLDGRLIASASDGLVKLWDAATTLEIRTIESDALWTHCVTFSPDGTLLASAGSDGKVKLWDVVTGREARAFAGHTDTIRSVDFSPDGHWLASGGNDGTVRLWNAATGYLVRTLAGHARGVRSVAFTPDGRWLASGGEDGTVRLWEVATGLIFHTLVGHTGSVLDVAFSPDGARLASASVDQTVRLWNVATGGGLGAPIQHAREVYAVAFSPDGRWLASAGSSVRLWDLASGREPVTLTSRRPTGMILSLAFSPKADWLVAGCWASTVQLWDVSGAERATLSRFASSVSQITVGPGTRALAAGGGAAVRLWDLTGGRQARVLRSESSPGYTPVAFSPDGALIASGGVDKKVKLWEAATGREVKTLSGFTDEVSTVAFSPSGDLLATGSGHPVMSARGDNTAKIWDIATGRVLRALRGHRHYVRAVAFSPDGRWLATGSDDTTVKLWDLSSGNAIRTLEGHRGRVMRIVFSPDGRLLASGSDDGTVRLWEIATGREVRSLPADARSQRRGAPPVAFSPDGRWLASGSDGRNITLWDVSAGGPERVLRGHAGAVFSVAFAHTGDKILSGSLDGTVRIWDVKTGTEHCRLIGFEDGTWAVVDADGRFDASNGGDVDGLHWVAGTEPIALIQLKERYYDPGLLAKVLGFNKEPLRQMQGFATPALYPEIVLHGPTPGQPTLGITLTNRGGGIGKVTVSINGKEVEADARGPTSNPDAKRVQLEVPLGNHPYLVPGKENVIAVRALNAEGYLSSRGVVVAYQPPGEVPLEKPTLWAIIAGISDYAGDRIDLRYAAKDAVDMAKALKLGATRLFGAEKVELALLTTTEPGSLPTKANIKSAFERTRAAKSSDILLVYLAGHGVAVGDIYYYLTQEARSTDLTDPAIRGQGAISSEEMISWLKQSPALKQVMVLDTCAAGTAADKLVEKREISSDQIRAIERLRDRIGFHILMGSAADAVSYEATQYEQGLLTHALLQGMKGAALRDEEYVDVSNLFQYAADAVPSLATHIGGIQRPRIAAPRGTSFDIGQLTAGDRQHIPLARGKPMLLAPLFLNLDQGFDNLELALNLRKLLREASYTSPRGDHGQFPAVFVDAEQLPGAIRPSGTYSVKDKTITVNLVLVRDGHKLRDLQLAGTANDLDVLSRRILEHISKAVDEIR